MRVPDISIIVPVHNGQDHLAECLDSLVQQEGVEFEIVCVNDCSADGSASILERYSKQDQRLRVLHHQTRQGAAQARNTGIENARGEYVLFVDCDDLLSREALWLLASAAEGGVDLIKGRLATFRVHEKTGEVSCRVESWGLTGPATFRANPMDLLPSVSLGYGAEHVTYLMRLGLLRDPGLRYPGHLTKGEDNLFMVKVLLAADTISLVPEVVYYYRHTLEAPKPYTPEDYYSRFLCRVEFIEHLHERGLSGLAFESFRSDFYGPRFTMILQKFLEECPEATILELLERLRARLADAGGLPFLLGGEDVEHMDKRSLEVASFAAVLAGDLRSYLCCQLGLRRKNPPRPRPVEKPRQMARNYGGRVLELEQQVRDLHNSWSWRITATLRWVLALVKGR